MSDVKTQACDVCGILRKESNHWFAAATYRGHFSVVTWEFREQLHRDAASDFTTLSDLCSENCIAKALSKSLGAGE